MVTIDIQENILLNKLVNTYFYFLIYALFNLLLKSS